MIYFYASQFSNYFPSLHTNIIPPISFIFFYSHSIKPNFLVFFYSHQIEYIDEVWKDKSFCCLLISTSGLRPGSGQIT